MSLKKKQIKEIKDFLLAEQERLRNAFVVDEERYQLKADDRKDEVDQASVDYEQSQQLRFRNRDLFYAKKINNALDKLNNDEYGACEECGEDIKFERLKARPTAELCIACKDEAEREESANFIARQSKSLGKKIDLVRAL
jgi:DnaK suppressor protein